MKRRDLNLYVSIVAFIAGSLFVLSNDASITANVIGATSESATLTAVIGILTIIASAVFFVLTINHGDLESEVMVHRDDNKHDDLNREQCAKAELEEKYGYHSYNDKKK